MQTQDIRLVMEIGLNVTYAFLSATTIFTFENKSTRILYAVAVLRFSGGNLP